MLACICGGTVETVAIVAASTGLIAIISNWMTGIINQIGLKRHNERLTKMREHDESQR